MYTFIISTWQVAVRQDIKSQITSLSPPPWTSSWWSPPSWPGDAPLGACGPLLSWNDEPRPDRCRTNRRDTRVHTVHNHSHHSYFTTDVYHQCVFFLFDQILKTDTLKTENILYVRAEQKHWSFSSSLTTAKLYKDAGIVNTIHRSLALLTPNKQDSFTVTMESFEQTDLA